ncbi:MAG: InlB B-repeat-containing protein, partial [Wujia sp.]
NYVLDGGTNGAGNPAGYTYGTGVTSFADASKEGYTFDGWYSDADFTTKVTAISETQIGDITLYAKFTANTYNITYDTDGGTNGAGNPTSYTYGTGVTSFADASKEGYIFDGWYKESGFITKVTAISETQTGDITLYAKFTEAEYSINYVLDGGTNGAGNPTSYTYGTGVTSFADASKEGYTFDGWYKESGFITKVTAISGTQTGDITLYAKFTEAEYSINYVLDGGTNGAGNPAGYTYGTGVTSFADASKEGYTFDGWYSDADFTTKVTAISETQTGDITLYAKFTEAEYSINYVLDGGTNGAGNPAGYTYGTGVTSFADASKEGYTFDGWYSDADFTTKVTAISETQTGDITLYAKFTEADYSIHYILNGGTNADDNPSGYIFGMGVAGFKDASKKGYTFEGWYSDADFTTEVSSISASHAGDVTLYAKFTANKYGITYNLNGGINAAGNPASYTYGKGVTSFADASKEGYTFKGWYSDADFTTKVTSISTTHTGTVTLYAKFTRNVVVDDLKDGVGSIVIDDVYYGESIKPVLASATNGIEHVKIEYKQKGAEDSSYTTKKPVKAGEYTARATFAKTEQYLEVIATDDFRILKKEGSGSVAVADIYYGRYPEPVVASSTNGIANVTIEYKKKNASDDTYTYLKPASVGEYTVRATFAETEGYLTVTTTDDFSISYLNAPEMPYNINGTLGENSYYTSAVTIVPATGYLIADSLDGTYRDKLELTKSSDGFYVYLINVSTGEKTSGIKVPEIKIDNDMPVIMNVTSGETIYGDNAEIIIEDDNLQQVLVNGNKVEFENGRAVLQLDSNQGEEEYEIICVDLAGNSSKINIIVAAEWMKSKLIPSGEKIKLYKKYSYTLGGGTWKVSGDNTTYAGNVTFCVNRDGEYLFSNGK